MRVQVERSKAYRDRQRRIFCSVIVMLLASLLACSSPPETAPAAPNILLIMADDLGFNDLAINNKNPEIQTPNLDALAGQGIRFTRHYTDSTCSPSRAAFLSGMYPARVGFASPGRGLSPQLTTLPEALRAEGYATVHIGKWHVGDSQREAWPDAQGFDEWYGYLNQWRLRGKRVDGEIVPARPTYKNPWLSRNGEPEQQRVGHLDGILADEAIESIRRLSGGEVPWFINLWFNAPHAPIMPSDKFAALYPDTPAGKYRALVHEMDTNVGRVLKALEASPAAKNTIVVFVSDNGGTNRELDNNAPFHGKKMTFHEGGVRTPLIIRWPGMSAPGSVHDDIVTIYDLYPTILGLSGVDIPAGLDGRDFFHHPEAGRQDKPGLFWELHTGGHYGYSVLSHAGRYRLYKTWPYMPWETPAQIVDLEQDPDGRDYDNSGQLAVMPVIENEYLQWHRDVHSVDVALELDANGQWLLTGSDFLRTPGYAGFTFSAGVAPGYVGNIATQEGIWSLEKTAAGAIELQAQSIRLQGTVDILSTCHSVSVSGNFARKISIWGAVKDHMTVELYVDGVLAQSVSEPGKLDDSNFRAPTRLGPRGLSPVERGPVFKPQVLSTSLDSSPAWSAETLHDAVCGV